MGRKKKTTSTEDLPALNVNQNESSKRQSLDAASNDVKSVTGNQDELSDEEKKYYNDLRKFLIPKLRSASYRWPERYEAVKAARKARGVYECASCSSEMKNGEYIIDHVQPVIPLEGWSGRDWNAYIPRMFCKRDNFQLLCKMCSTIKTDAEVQIRKMYRQKKKDENKP